jgi:4-amino-4-deoxy-L-arabinose transferase-like glycosyltransferase
VAVILLGFFARVWALERVPPGWRDDELIESLVISQAMLDGDLRLYYPDASGHEPLYHGLNAIFLAAFGPTGLGIRLVSALLGTLALPLTYLVGRRLFGHRVGLLAAALLAVSFWGLMYSRVGIRHVTTPPLALAAFYWFLRGVSAPVDRGRAAGGRSPAVAFALSGLFLGLGFYAYFASRGVALIPAAFLVYLVLVAGRRWRPRWRDVAVLFGVAVLVALPLFVAIRAQPQAEARVSELAMPINEARAGNFRPLFEYAWTALTMAHAAGDPEWLYNIPGRPIFGLAGAIFFWTGMALALWWAFGPVVATARYALSGRERGASWPEARWRSVAAAFLLLWWLVGISPDFLSVPPASLGHAIVAQPAFYLLAALPVGAVALLRPRLGGRADLLAVALGLLLFGATAVRDLGDYFREWPSRGMVRYLYRADIHDVAAALQSPGAPADFGITGLLAGPWDRVALELEAGSLEVRPRWVDPRRALLIIPALSFAGYPDVESPFAAAYEPVPDAVAAGGYALSRVDSARVPSVAAALAAPDDPVCFTNGLCFLGASADPAAGYVDLAWRAERPLDLPPMPLISNPPPPGVYSGPRLYAFAQLLDAEGAFLAGDDGLWVDPATLRAGDVFAQRHLLDPALAPDAAALAVGLYDPMTGERILTADGRDAIRLELNGQ